MKAPTLLLPLIVATVAAPLICTSCGGSQAASQTTLTTSPASYTIGGSISGLTGTGLVLQENAANNLTVAAGATTFTFSNRIPSGSAYAVAVLTQPSNPPQTCSLTNSSGIVNADVTNIQLTCADVPTYSIGGTISGLVGTGLVLQDNGGDNLSVIAGQSSFAFPTRLLSGSTFNVAVLTQPSGQNCSVANATGTVSADVTNVQVVCLALSFSVGGSIYGLSGTGLTLQDNGGDSLSIAALQTSFTFANLVPAGDPYSASVLKQPSNPQQTCVVTAGSGIANMNVSNIQVACTSEWAWVNGSSALNQPGTYGTLGIPNSSNSPGARSSAATWTDGAGDFWLFGGYGYDALGHLGQLGDLWEYSGGEWAWVGGSEYRGATGTYGTQGTGSPLNTPGARQNPASWTDSSGALWLFGGFGVCNDFATRLFCNDLWKYSGGEWTWVSGSSTGNQPGTYGVLGVASSSNAPGSRYSIANWSDSAGNLWLFGGNGLDSTATVGDLDDLWRFGSGQWTWMGGSNLANQQAIYGTEGVSSPGNTPGARQFAASWTDASGNFWLFGGQNYSATQLYGNLNDLWKYTDGQWTWVSGSDATSESGSYGTQGIPSASNVPGSRGGPAVWTDASGNFWLLGGYGIDGQGGSGFLSDLWKYDSGKWTWVDGPDEVNQMGSYGTIGVAAPGNAPGMRYSPSSWIDATGNLWLFGGASFNYVSDLWEFQP